MPVYEYQCQKCGKVIEALRKVDDPAPKCCGVKMKKLISKGSFILKGKGWYATDYKEKKGEAKNNPKKDAS